MYCNCPTQKGNVMITAQRAPKHCHALVQVQADALAMLTPSPIALTQAWTTRATACCCLLISAYAPRIYKMHEVCMGIKNRQMLAHVPICT